MLETDKKYEEMYKEIRSKQEALAEYIKSKPALKVEDYILQNPDGTSKKLSELFGDKNELILVHNMGKSCPYCHMWTGAYSGLLPHLRDRAEFVVVSPDSPEVQKEVIEERGYDFPMYSADGTSFIQDMGFYEDKEGYYMPGFSIFVRDDDGNITRTAKDFFGPYDLYNPAWHMFALLPEGANKWGPKINY